MESVIGGARPGPTHGAPNVIMRARRPRRVQRRVMAAWSGRRAAAVSVFRPRPSGHVSSRGAVPGCPGLDGLAGEARFGVAWLSGPADLG